MLLWPSSFIPPSHAFSLNICVHYFGLRLKAEKRRVGEKRKRQPTKKSQQKMMTEKRMGDKVFQARKRGEEMTREKDGDDREWGEKRYPLFPSSLPCIVSSVTCNPIPDSFPHHEEGILIPLVLVFLGRSNFILSSFLSHPFLWWSLWPEMNAEAKYPSLHFFCSWWSRGWRWKWHIFLSVDGYECDSLWLSPEHDSSFPCIAS